MGCLRNYCNWKVLLVIGSIVDILLDILFFGSITSLIYTIETKQKLFTAWAPYVWPIKTLMLIGILLMLLQAFSSLFKNIANVRNRKI